MPFWSLPGSSGLRLVDPDRTGRRRAGDRLFSQTATETKVVRIAAFPLSAQSSGHMSVWKHLQAQAEAERPDIQIEFVNQPVDIYETIGLPALLAGDRPPDIMFEWAGERVAVLRRYGFLADLTEPLRQGDWGRRFLPLAWTGTVIEDRNYMVPWSIEVTNLIWYNKSIFAAHRLSEPKTWDEFLAVCENLRRAGVQPVCVGNKQQWPAGNWNSGQCRTWTRAPGRFHGLSLWW